MSDHQYLIDEVTQLRATLDRVRDLVAPWVPVEQDRTHSEHCYQFHPDCLVAAIRATLGAAQTGQEGPQGAAGGPQGVSGSLSPPRLPLRAQDAAANRRSNP